MKSINAENNQKVQLRLSDDLEHWQGWTCMGPLQQSKKKRTFELFFPIFSLAIIPKDQISYIHKKIKSTHFPPQKKFSFQ